MWEWNCYTWMTAVWTIISCADRSTTLQRSARFELTIIIGSHPSSNKNLNLDPPSKGHTCFYRSPSSHLVLSELPGFCSAVILSSRLSVPTSPEAEQETVRVTPAVCLSPSHHFSAASANDLTNLLWV